MGNLYNLKNGGAATLGDVTMGALTATTGEFSGALQGTTGEFSGALQGTTLTATTRFIGKTTSFATAVTADGAIAIPLYDTTFFFTKAGIAASTIINPTATTHDGLTLTFVSTTTDSNTLANTTGSGFNGGGAGAMKASWAAAIGNNLTIQAYQGVWYVVGTPVGVTLGVA